MSALRAVVVRPGRSSYGEIRRTQTWLRLFRAAGGEADDLGFLARGSLGPSVRDPWRLARSSIVPEAIVWNGPRLAERIRRLEPDVVVMQTARSYRPELCDGPWVPILDLVDRLSASYHQRAALASNGAKRAVLNRLAAAHGRFEESARERVENIVAAGWGDSAHLGATWVPNLVDPTERPRPVSGKPYDAVFFGSLGYAPNVEALRWLARGRPTDADLRVLVAGHAPTDEVRSLCRDRGWKLVEDYPSNEWLSRQATISLAPLRSTAGIQNKVLEAAALGLPQVVAPPALAGLADGFPAVVAETPEEFVARARSLVDNIASRTQLADDAWAYAHEHYTVDSWLPTLWQLVNPSEDVAPAWVTSGSNRPMQTGTDLGGDDMKRDGS